MTEYYGIDVCRIEGEVIAVALFAVPATLHHTAIEQYAMTRGTDDVTRAGYFAGGPVKLQLHQYRLFTTTTRSSGRSVQVYIIKDRFQP
jgi:hypothetical protein